MAVTQRDNANLCPLSKVGIELALDLGGPENEGGIRK